MLMKVKFLEQIETEKEIELPYYYIDKFGNQCKAYEHHSVRINCSEIKIHKESFQTLFHSKSLETFIERQLELKTQFDKTLAEVMGWVEPQNNAD